MLLVRIFACGAAEWSITPLPIFSVRALTCTIDPPQLWHCRLSSNLREITTTTWIVSIYTSKYQRCGETLRKKVAYHLSPLRLQKGRLSVAQTHKGNHMASQESILPHSKRQGTAIMKQCRNHEQHFLAQRTILFDILEAQAMKRSDTKMNFLDGVDALFLEVEKYAME
jgi:hypothetical protein